MTKWENSNQDNSETVLILSAFYCIAYNF